MKHSRVYGLFLLAMTALVFALAVFRALSVPQAINADALYPLTFVADLVRHEPILWYVPPANFFLPDVLVAAIGYFAGLRRYDNIVLADAFVCSAIFIAGYAFLRASGMRRLPSVVAAMLTVSVLALFGTGSTLLAHTLAVPVHHAGVVALELAAATLFLAYAAGPDRRVALLLGAVTALAVFVDRLAIAQFAAPAAVMAGWLWRSDGKRSVRGLFASLFAGVCVGMLAIWLVDRSPSLHHSITIPFEQGVLTLLHRVRLSLLQIPKITGVVYAVLFAACYVAVVVLAVDAARRKRAATSTILIFGALLSTAALLTPIAAGLWVDDTSVRYQLPFFVVPMLIISGILLERVLVPPRGLLWAVIAIVALTLTSAGTSALGWRGVRAANDAAFAEQASLVEHLVETSTPVVFAQYWAAKPILYLSDFRVDVCEITDKGKIAPFVANLSWCIDALRSLSAHAPPSVPFVDYAEKLDLTALQDELGPPEKTQTIGGFSVTFYSSGTVRNVLTNNLCSTLRSFGRPDALDACRHQD